MMIKFSEIDSSEKKRIISEMQKGKIFIYPTDTIYGIGCDASNDESVRKIRELKKREKMPFSVIVPSKAWLYENCEINSRSRIFIEKLPGPFTYLFKLRKAGRKKISENLIPGLSTLRIRIPNHPFTEIIAEFGKPFVTTSVNLSGKPFIKKISEIPDEFRKKCIIIDAGQIKGKPSLLIDITGKMPKILKR